MRTFVVAFRLLGVAFNNFLIVLLLCIGVNFFVIKNYSIDIFDETGISGYVNETAIKVKIDDVIRQASYDVKHMTFGMPKYSDQEITEFKEYFVTLSENRQNMQVDIATQQDMDKVKRAVLSFISKHSPSIGDNISTYQNRNKL